MRCANCGREAPDWAAFCPFCGARLERPEPVEETADSQSDLSEEPDDQAESGAHGQAVAEPQDEDCDKDQAIAEPQDEVSAQIPAPAQASNIDKYVEAAMESLYAAVESDAGGLPPAEEGSEPNDGSAGDRADENLEPDGEPNAEPSGESSDGSAGDRADEPHEDFEPDEPSTETDDGFWFDAEPEEPGEPEGDELVDEPAGKPEAAEKPELVDESAVELEPEPANELEPLEADALVPEPADDSTSELERTVVRPPLVIDVDSDDPEAEPAQAAEGKPGSEPGAPGRPTRVTRTGRTSRAKREKRSKSGTDPTTPAEPSAPQKGRKALVIGLVLVAVALSAFAAWYTYDQEMWGGKTVPVVVSLVEDDARAQLEAKGFVAEVEEQPVDEAVGTVLSEEPDDQSRLPEGSTVRIVVGVARVMPAVVGQSGAYAVQVLTDAGLVVTTQEVLSDEGEGTVLASSLSEGATFKTGDGVTLTLAKARVVPDVVGMGKSDATAAIEAQGLTVKVAYQEADSGIGTVLAVSPEAGTKATADTAVTITVAKQKGVTVPNLIGMKYTWTGSADEAIDNAKAKLEAMGLRFQKVSIPPDGSHSLGEVIWQDPLPGAVVSPGSTVQVYEISQ